MITWIETLSAESLAGIAATEARLGLPSRPWASLSASELEEIAEAAFAARDGNTYQLARSYLAL